MRLWQSLGLGLLSIALTATGQTNATPIHFLVPGLMVQELPVHLSNINNLRFAPDGRLTALGYDGKIHLLSDSNGDGLEDRDDLFWDKPTISVPVGMAWSKQGLYVSSHGKVSLLRDIEGDGKADIEEVVATNWPPTDVASGGVDATAVTLDREGNLYFGLLTADYSNPYRIKDGVAHYDLNGKRGTIQKLSADRRLQETIATGIRVPYTLAFNRHGDLFVTDQEGATWCPGGNPLDELDQIIRGRNYGFPPRNPLYLPDLVSDAPVVAFAPQHQSSCGFFFNESSPGKPTFGPAFWEGDAFVAGESRGKIWRVKLVKVMGGYIGRDFLVVRLPMLTTDVALSPKGDLYVSCHSGQPDWGTGPAGEGKIFKITYVDHKAPQPVAVWAASPLEVRVAFDRSLAAGVPNGMTNATVEFGEFVSAADRFESMRPSYEVVGRQLQAPRGRLRVVSAALADGGRTLVLLTSPHPQTSSYALTLPDVRGLSGRGSSSTVDLGYDLNGVEAEWTPSPGLHLRATHAWKGWLPHLDMQVNHAFLHGSFSHETFFRYLAQRGHLRMRTTFHFPAARSWLRIEANHPIALNQPGLPISGREFSKGWYAVETDFSSTNGTAEVDLSMETGGDMDPQIRALQWSDMDKIRRPLPLAALRLPWAPADTPSYLESHPSRTVPEGDYENGRSLFFSDRLRCSTCHRIRGEGATIGPDLSNLVSRDSESVLRDIREPSYAINPDYVAYNVSLKNGNEISGFVHVKDARSLVVSGADGAEHSYRYDEVSEMKVSSISLMPAGLLETLKEPEVRDLLTFLCVAPPVRTADEIKKLAGELKLEAPPAAANHRQLRIVLVDSKQDHGPGQHDYPAWLGDWKPWLSRDPDLNCKSAWEWPDAEDWQKADVMLFYYWNHQWTDDRLRQLDEFQARGGGVVLLHAAVICDDRPELLAQRIGLAAQPKIKYRHMPLQLKPGAGSQPDLVPPAILGMDWLDEAYWPLFGDVSRTTVLAQIRVDGSDQPQIWTFEKGSGRVFASIPGHYTWTWRDPVYRLMILRAIEWAAHEPPGALGNLAHGVVEAPLSSQ